MSKYDFLKNKNGNNNTFKSSGKYDFIKPEPKKPTLGKKAVGVVKDIGKAIISPVATMAARPLQLGYELIKPGDNFDEMDKFSREKLGGLVAPLPRTGKDLIGEGGRALQTVALGIPATKTTTLFGKSISPLSSKFAPTIMGSQKVTPQVLKTTQRLSQSAGLGTEGAIFGLGADMEQGTTGTNTLMGAGIGALIPFAGAGISKVLGKSKTPTLTKGLAQKEIDNIVASSTGKIDDSIISKTVDDVYDLKTSMIRLENEGYSKNQIIDIMGNVVKEQPNVNKYSDEIVSKYKSNIKPELEPKFVKPKTYQEPPIKKSNGEELFETSKTVNKEISKTKTTSKTKNNYKFSEETKKSFDEEFADLPEYQKSGWENWQNEFNQLSREDFLKMATGKMQSPPNLPATAILKFARALPDLTPKETKILASKFVRSKAGAELVAIKRTVDTAADFVEKYNTVLQENINKNIKSKSITSKTTKRFLDGLEC